MRLGFDAYSYGLFVFTAPSALSQHDGGCT